MKKTATLLAALLVAAVPTVSLFASCTKGEEKTGDNEVVEGEQQPGEEVEENRLDNEFSPNIPQEDVSKFEGSTFSMLIGSVGGVIYAEEENSKPVNDTAYRRNKLIEDHFGITLNIVKGGYAATGVFEGPHWDPEKESLGIKCRRIFIEFDRIQDPMTEDIIMMDKLMEVNPKYKWSSQTSGIEIPAHIAAEVERVWKNISR